MTHSEKLPRRRSTSSRLLWSVLDQGFSSGSNFILVFLLARGTSPQEFGLLMIGYTIITVAVAVSRNTFGAIFGIDLPRINAADSSVLVSRSAAAVLLTAAPVSLILVGYAAIAPVTADGQRGLTLLAVALPLVLLQDLQRFWSVAQGAPMHAAAADFLWLVTAASGFFLPRLYPGLGSVTVGACAFTLGALLSFSTLIAMGYRLRPQLRGVVTWLRSDVRRLHLATDSVLSSSIPLANSSIIAILGGPQLVAAIRGAGILFGPLNLLSATFPLALVPEAVRSSQDRARRLFVLAAVAFGLVACLWGVSLHYLPSSAGAQLLGESWTLVQPIVLITMVEYVGLGVWAVSRSRLVVQERLRTALRLRVGFSAATLVLPIMAVLLGGTAAAIAATLAATSLIFALVSWRVSQPR